MNNDIREDAKLVIDKVYARCKNEMPEAGKETDLLTKLCVSQTDKVDEVLLVLYSLFEIPEVRQYPLVSEKNTPHCSENWQRDRMLINRILGKMKRMNPYPIGTDHISLAMDDRKIKKLWKDVYDSNGYEPHVSSFWYVFLAVHDLIQQHGGIGVWGGNLTRKKFGECIEYRELFHNNRRYAYTDEFYSGLFGWW